MIGTDCGPFAMGWFLRLGIKWAFIDFVFVIRTALKHNKSGFCNVLFVSFGLLRCRFPDLWAYGVFHTSFHPRGSHIMKERKGENLLQEFIIKFICFW